MMRKIWALLAAFFASVAVPVKLLAVDWSQAAQTVQNEVQSAIDSSVPVGLIILAAVASLAVLAGIIMFVSKRR